MNEWTLRFLLQSWCVRFNEVWGPNLWNPSSSPNSSNHNFFWESTNQLVTKANSYCPTSNFVSKKDPQSQLKKKSREMRRENSHIWHLIFVAAIPPYSSRSQYCRWFFKKKEKKSLDTAFLLLLETLLVNVNLNCCLLGTCFTCITFSLILKYFLVLKYFLWVLEIIFQ